ncbi:hypothetical protein CJF39_22340 [Pseudomonas lundensis]|jgi:hypothetical protein|uniref:Uncharacterized protein n=3 Tax=Pseudomonas TaxID=286 RepID=A0A266N4J7_9PSED|nr:MULTISPECIES: hypothetical protein [Pseudomonas]MQU09541.1 hypothetical protein [Pseudomonas helleri]OZY57290.1 hypothetical protein CJF39_22340 [Pseudomonas lundensis]
MTEVDFLSQCLELGAQRRYANKWPYLMFKERYGREASRETKKAASAQYCGEVQEISDELLDWLDAYWRKSFAARETG